MRFFINFNCPVFYMYEKNIRSLIFFLCSSGDSDEMHSLELGEQAPPTADLYLALNQLE